MRWVLLIGVLTGTALAAPLAAHAQAQVSPAAQRILDRARSASGGAAAWNGLAGAHETGNEEGGRFERWSDMVRYGLRSELGAGESKLTEGYNGAGAWRILPDGVTVAEPAAEELREIRTNAFFASYGYFFPSRFALRATHVGTRRAGNRTFDVLRLHPEGAEPRQAWFDRRTGLLSVIVDEVGPRQARITLSDFRKVGRVTVSFESAIEPKGGTVRRRTLETLEFTPNDRALFSLPRPESAPPPEEAHAQTPAAAPPVEFPPIIELPARRPALDPEALRE